MQCPSEKTPPQTDPTKIGYTDYAFNSNLARRKEVAILVPESTILVCEGIAFSSEQPKDGDDTPLSEADNCNGSSRTPGATAGLYKLIQANQPAGSIDMHPDVSRHFGGGSYVFADGHVKWLLPDKIYNNCTAPGGGNATFAYK